MDFLQIFVSLFLLADFTVKGESFPHDVAYSYEYCPPYLNLSSSLYIKPSTADLLLSNITELKNSTGQLFDLNLAGSVSSAILSNSTNALTLFPTLAVSTSTPTAGSDEVSVNTVWPISVTKNAASTPLEKSLSAVPIVPPTFEFSTASFVSSSKSTDTVPDAVSIASGTTKASIAHQASPLFRNIDFPISKVTTIPQSFQTTISIPSASPTQVRSMSTPFSIPVPRRQTERVLLPKMQIARPTVTSKAFFHGRLPAIATHVVSKQPKIIPSENLNASLTSSQKKSISGNVEKTLKTSTKTKFLTQIKTIMVPSASTRTSQSRTSHVTKPTATKESQKVHSFLPVSPLQSPKVNSGESKNSNRIIGDLILQQSLDTMKNVNMTNVFDLKPEIDSNQTLVQSLGSHVPGIKNIGLPMKEELNLFFSK